MKLSILLIIGTCLGLACTPFEREVAEEVLHEASVAEQAVEADLERGMVDKSAPMYHPEPNPTQIKNQRQYPKRNTNRSYPNRGA